MARAGAKLAKWSRTLLWIGLASIPPAAIALGNQFFVQQARDETYFIINNHDFESRNRVCRFFEEGDAVIFVTGDPEGRCLTAVIKNLSNGQSCEFWCRDEPYQR
jgi:hypothetical protein